MSNIHIYVRPWYETEGWSRALEDLRSHPRRHKGRVHRALNQECAMAATPDVRPVGDLPDTIGKTAARELSLHGITHLDQVAARSKKELLAIHGVGPKAIAILGEALATKGLAYRES